MAVSLSDVVTYKRLVVLGYNEVWYEDIDVAAGAMIELDTTSGAIDTTDQLDMFEAYGKVFIVNGANFKVADFVNTKLSTDDVRPNDVTNVAPIHGTVLTGGTTGAKMVVDYCDANNGAALIYGYVISGTFNDDDETVTGTNADGTPTAVSFTLDALPVAKPHWYDWTVYPTIGGISFGTMPNKAYIGCNYRGRTVISGNPEYPYQWYMARQANPFDFAYTANDAQSAVAGGNSDAGEIGDVIRALIPYKDDYLVFGCAATMWYLAGDPMAGGEIQEMDLTVGIFGAKSWCFDGEGNLYFWGTNGIYRTSIPGTPKCISEIRLPKLIKDKDADPSTHRITLAYDRRRAGIIISIILVADGTNSNYFYDLTTGGFFPETYPEECAPYSLFYYSANNDDYSDLLVGCKDGYIRKFDDGEEDDDIGNTDEAITSYVSFGPLLMSDDPKFSGKVTGLSCITAGGAASGSQSDSNDIECKIFTANSAEEIVEQLSANSAPKLTKTIKAPGRWRGNSVKRKIRGIYSGVRLGNSTATETWGFEQLILDITKAGRFK